MVTSPSQRSRVSKLDYHFGSNCPLSYAIEKEAFKKKMKSHYKGEFNMAALLRAKPPVDEDEDDD